MWKLKVRVFVLAVAVYVAAGSCLKDYHPRRSTSRIIGGSEVDITDFPHQVSLIYKGKHKCGGSIISETYVLTAAHCVKGRNVSDFKVRTGSRYWAKGGVLHDVARITHHPLFNISCFDDYDVAIVKIAGRITIDGVTTKIVELAEPGSVLKNGEPVVVSGWGRTIATIRKISHVLKAVTLSFLEKTHCKPMWHCLTDRMMCAATKELQRSCMGDSGGPLIDSNFVQHGIVSFGSEFCDARSTVFASVPNLRQWIRENSGV